MDRSGMAGYLLVRRRVGAVTGWARVTGPLEAVLFQPWNSTGGLHPDGQWR